VTRDRIAVLFGLAVLAIIFGPVLYCVGFGLLSGEVQ
jgi:hypothetical protein